MGRISGRAIAGTPSASWRNAPNQPPCLLIIALQDRIGRKAMASASLLLSGIFISVTGGIIFAAAASDKSEFSPISCRVE